MPVPEADADARAQDPSMIMLNSMTLLPLLLAGAAFAKVGQHFHGYCDIWQWFFCQGYLFGNIKNLKSGQYGGYGHRLGHPYGYGQYGYGRRISVEGGEYSQPGVYGGEYTTSKENTELPTNDQFEEYSNNNQQYNTDYQPLQYSPYYGYWTTERYNDIPIKIKIFVNQNYLF